MNVKQTKLTRAILVLFSLSLLVFLCQSILSAAASPAHTTISKANSHYPGVHIVTEVNDSTATHSAVQYPAFKQKALNKPISDYITEEKQLFQTAVRAAQKSWLPKPAAAQNISFRIYPLTDSVYSIVFQHSYSVGKSGRMHASRVFFADLTDSTIKSGTSFFESEASVQALLKQASSLSVPVKAVSSFYIKKEKMVFVFEQNSAIEKVAVPLQEVKPLLKSKWRSQLAAAAEQTPPPPISGPKPASYPAGSKKVALTFDDGPHPEYTKQILRTLDQYRAKATFFVLGSRADFYPELLRAMKAGGHEIGNHSWNHPDFTKLPPEKIREELGKTSKFIEQTSGAAPSLYRPPYGATNQAVQQSAGELTEVLWSVDTLDWKTKDPAAITRQVQEHTKDGSIILMHDIHASTAAALEPVLAWLTAEGYHIVPVSDL